jgi:thioredoxin-like negative regulator of GroEL
VIPKHFESCDVLQLDLSSIFQFYRRQEIWILYFMNPKSDTTKKFADVYKQLAEKLYGIIKVGAIDCLSEEELCEEFGVYEHDQIVIFNENYSDDGTKYRGEMTVDKIANAAVKDMQSFVSSVNSDNWQSFIEREPTKHKILHFTEKKSTPTVIKALSKRFRDKLTFGEIRSDETELIRKFKITKFPTILALTDPDGYSGDVFEGELKVDQLSKFIQSYAYQTPKKVLKTEFQELTERKYKSGQLCSPKRSELCLVLFT